MGIQSVICALSYAIILSSHIRGRRVWSFPLFTFFIVVSIPYQIGYGADQRLHLDLAMCVLRLAVAFEAAWRLCRLHSTSERLWFSAVIYSGILFSAGPSIERAAGPEEMRHLLTTAAGVSLLLTVVYDRVAPFRCLRYVRAHLYLLLAWQVLRIAQTWIYRMYTTEAAWIAARWVYVIGMVLIALGFASIGGLPRRSPARIAEGMEEEQYG